MKKLVALLMPFLALPVFAQEEIQEVKVTTVTVPDTYWEDASDEGSKVLNTTHFRDNWFLGIQVGDMFSWGTNSPKAKFMENQNFAIGAQWGKWIAPWMGVRLHAIYGHNHGQLLNPNVGYKFVTWGGAYDMLFSLTNIFAKFKEERRLNLVGIVGVGFNHAGHYQTNDPRLGATRSNFFTARLGAEVIYRLSNEWDLNIEATNNWINSNFDAQEHGNRYDGHLDILLGFTYRFKNQDGSRGFTYARYNASRYDYLNDQINRLRAEADAKRNGTPVVNIQKKVVDGNLVRTLISFEDNKYAINELQEVNIYTAAEEYKKMGDASIYITPYGDYKPNNVELFSQRANEIKNALMNEYFIPAGNIYIESNPQIVANLNNKNTVVVFVNE